MNSFLKIPISLVRTTFFFQVFADRNNVTIAEYEKVREQFFSKGQPCFRASPLTKKYGFGIHSDKNGKVALFGMESNEYQKFLEDKNIKKVKAMKSNKLNRKQDAWTNQ